MKKQKGSADLLGSGFGILLMLLIFALPLIGYVKNVVSFCNCDFETSIKAELIRGVGIVIPVVGMITGWVDIKDGKVPEKITVLKIVE